MKTKVSPDDAIPVDIKQLSIRLDALIRLFIESQSSKNGGQLNEGTSARILKSVGLTPTEIARILGKDAATDVAPYLYGKKAKKQLRNSTPPDNQNGNQQVEDNKKH